MDNFFKILYLGDVVGRPARDFICSTLDSIRRIHGIDLIVANAENATSGAGITTEHCELLHSAGIDIITLGDHVWDRRELVQTIDNLPYVCRPANLPSECPGKVFVSARKNGISVGVGVVLGRHFMKINASCPFAAMDEILKAHRSEVDVFLAEIHAEATSEKIAFGWEFDGKVSGIVGSHTHVQTADERILPKGTAYISDLGMCGPHESVIGREIVPVLFSMRTSMPQKFEVAKGDVRLNGVIITIDRSTKTPTAISRFSEKRHTI